MGNRLSILTGLALTACGGPTTTAPGAGAPAIASAAAPLPGVPLTTLSGESAELANVAHGRVALVSLWATWCEACDREMDALNRLDASTGSGAVVIGVAVGEEREHVADFVRRRGLRYAQLVDRDFAFADAVGQRRLPATLVIDRKGRIVFRGEALDSAGLDALRRAVTTSD